MKRKTPDYILKTNARYQSKFDRIAVNLPKGSKQLISDHTGKSVNQFFNDLFQEWKQRNNIE